jgi:hypothetical protein
MSSTPGVCFWGRIARFFLVQHTKTGRIYQITNKYTIAKPSEIYQNCDFWFENKSMYHLAAPLRGPVNRLSEMYCKGQLSVVHMGKCGSRVSLKLFMLGMEFDPQQKPIVLFARNCHATEKPEAIAHARRCWSSWLTEWWTKKRMIGTKTEEEERHTGVCFPPQKIKLFR